MGMENTNLPPFSRFIAKQTDCLSLSRVSARCFLKSRHNKSCLYFVNESYCYTFKFIGIMAIFKDWIIKNYKKELQKLSLQEMALIIIKQRFIMMRK